MANPEHVEQLRLGVSEWNEWRKRNPSIRPDLSGENLPSELLGADLWGCNLAGSMLRNHDLTGANLFDTDLSGADLTGARLVGANLTYANLANANLMGANLIGCNLSVAEPWKAALFWEVPGLKSSHDFDDTQQDNGFIKTVGELLNYIRRTSQDYEHYNGKVPFYFRGESKIVWELSPSIMRDELLSEQEGQMLVDLASRRPEDFNELPSALAQWVLAQHHGLPTRFLDITKNPLVALFNACQENTEDSGRLHVFAVPRELVKPFNSDTVSVISNFARLTPDDQKLILGTDGFQGESYVWFQPDRYPEAMGRLYQLIQQEKPYFAERIEPRNFYQVFVVEPQQSLERIRSQSGSFLVSAFHRRFEQEKILEVNPNIPVYDHHVLTVPAEYKDSIMEELTLANITKESLFPGLDSSATSVVSYYRQRIADGPPRYLLE